MKPQRKKLAAILALVARLVQFSVVVILKGIVSRLMPAMVTAVNLWLANGRHRQSEPKNGTPPEALIIRKKV